MSPGGKLAALGGGFTVKSGVMGFGAGVRTRPLRVIDVATGREVESFKLAGNQSSPTDLSFSPDGEYIYFARRSPRSPMFMLARIPVIGGLETPVLDDVDSPVRGTKFTEVSEKFPVWGYGSLAW